MKKGRKTVGALSNELLKKKAPKHSTFDQMREQLDEYEENVHECVKIGLSLYKGDFYVLCLTKKERLMQNVMRNYFFPRKSCPTPDFDQKVYKYTREDDKLEFMWAIPDVDAVNYMKNNANLVTPDKYKLLEFVLSFVDGSLLRLSKKINGERRDSNILEN